MNGPKGQKGKKSMEDQGMKYDKTIARRYVDWLQSKIGQLHSEVERLKAEVERSTTMDNYAKEAHERLIAAAPELLKALQDLEAWTLAMTGYHRPERCRDFIARTGHRGPGHEINENCVICNSRDAIAKATGVRASLSLSEYMKRGISDELRRINR